MFDWITRRGSIARAPALGATVIREAARGRHVGKYQLLFKYLENRFADTVVLTFAQIEDLLGFALPEEARLHDAWWTAPELGAASLNYSASWTLASRMAKPNLAAQIVLFERLPRV